MSRAKRTELPDRSNNQARLREFLPLTLIGNVILVAFLIVVALTGLLLTNSSFVALPASVAQLWLLANGAPVASNSAELGFVPLLPSIGVVALMAWRVYSVVKERVSLADLVILIACVLGVPLLLTLTALAMLVDAATVLPVAVPNVAVALGRTFLVHSLAVVVGMGTRLWQALERRYWPDWPLLTTLRRALEFWVYLLGCSLVVLVALLVAHGGTVADLYGQMSGAGSAAGLTALSVLYLPNVLLGIAAVLLGSEFVIGEGVVSLFGSYLVPLPPLPVLAAIPGQMWEYSWLLLSVPLVLGAVVQFRYVRSAQHPFRDVGLIGLWSVVIALLVLALSIGRMGGYGLVGPLWWLTLALAPVWLWGAGLVVAGVGWFLDSRAEPESDEFLDDEEDDEDEAEEELPEELEELEEEESEAEESGKESASEGEDTGEDADTESDQDEK